jgi:hypothetical protein
MEAKRNCKDYCRFRRCCYAKGEPGLDPDDCPTAWKIEDILNDYNPADYQTDDDEPEEDDE